MATRFELPDPALVADEIFDRGLDAAMNEPRVAHILVKLTETDLRQLVAVVVAATATISTNILMAALAR